MSRWIEVDHCEYEECPYNQPDDTKAYNWCHAYVEPKALNQVSYKTFPNICPLGHER